MQDTWIAALQHPPDPDRPVRPWLAGILRRVASMRARAEGRRSWRQRRAARKDELPSAASLVGEVDLQQRLSREVLELDEPYRTTLLLRYFHDLPAVEIARRQGIPAGTVRWRLKRGLDDLRARLDRTFGDRRAWCLALVDLARREPAARATAGASTTVVAAAATLALVGLGAWALVDRDRSAPTPALPPAAPPPGRITLRIVEPRGAVAAGLRAVAAHADGTLTEVRSDDAGVVRFAADVGGGEGILWVDRVGSFIAPARFLHAAEPQDVPLPAGADFTGRARYRGAAPPAGLALEVDSDRMLPWGPLPADVADLLGVGRRARAVTDAQGRFTFHSLPADWSGELWLPAGWRHADRPPRGSDGPPHARLHVDLAAAPLALELERMPVARGRVLDPAGAAVEGARAVLRPRWLDGRSARVEAVTDARGAFEVELPRADLEHLVVTVEDERGALRTSQRRRRTAAPVDVLDLGQLTLAAGAGGRAELELERVATAEIRLVGADGAALVGVRLERPAAVPGVDEGGERPPPMLLELPGAASSDAAAGARSPREGWIALADLPVGEHLNLDVLDVLGRRLDVVTIGPLVAGERRAETQALTVAPRHLAGRCVERSGDVLLGVVLDFERAAGPEGADEGFVRLRSDPDGRFELPDLAAAPVAAIASKRGFVRRRVTFAATDLGRPVEVRLERAADLVVHAVDADGSPLERVALAARAGDQRWTAAETAPGVYTFLDLPRGPVALEWTHGAVRGRGEWTPSAGDAVLELGPGGGTVRGR